MKITILIGEICSGKSTYALKLVKEKNFIKFSLDDIKIMMYNTIPNDKQTEDVVTGILFNSLLLLQGWDNPPENVVVEGLPLNIEELHYIIDNFKVEIITFEISRGLAHLRNLKRFRQDGIFIKPLEMQRYSKLYAKFINSKEFFKLLTHKNVISVSNMENYEIMKKKMEMFD